MFGVCRAYIDKAGGTILVGNPFFFVDGLPVAVEGNPVEGHGDSPHNNPIMIRGNPNFLIGGIPVCTTGSEASCGDRALGSGSLFIGL